MRKALTYTSFASAGILMILAFLTAKTYAQLGVAVITYTLITYFAYKLFIKAEPLQAPLIDNNRRAPAIAIELPPLKQTKRPERIEVEEAKAEREGVGIADIDKRAFLKIIGAAGISFFVFSLLGRRAETLLFDRALNSGITGPLGEPASSGTSASTPSPMEGYKISEIDDNAITYYGFTNNDGGWLIMREDTEASSFRYAKGSSNFPMNWSNRANLDYDYFYNLF